MPSCPWGIRGDNVPKGSTYTKISLAKLLSGGKDRRSKSEWFSFTCWRLMWAPFHVRPGHEYIFLCKDLFQPFARL